VPGAAETLGKGFAEHNTRHSAEATRQTNSWQKGSLPSIFWAKKFLENKKTIFKYKKNILIWGGLHRPALAYLLIFCKSRNFSSGFEAGGIRTHDLDFARSLL